MPSFHRDDNHIPTIGAVSSVNGITPVELYADPTTHALLTSSSSAASTTLYALRLDEASSTITYIGEADPGTATSSALWRIKKMNSASGLIITWADGNSDFDNVWDDRATLTYS